MVRGLLGEGHVARQCTQPKRPRNSAWFKEKMLLVQVQESSQESKEIENKYMKKEIDLEKKIKELDNIVYKVGQSAQMTHMLTKSQVFYVDTHKQAFGYQNPFYLKKAQRIKPTLYDSIVISKKHDVTYVVDEEETLILEDGNFGKHFVPQKKLSAEQAFWLSILNSKSKPLAVTQSPVEIEVPKELPKTLRAYYEDVGISHQTFVARTPQQNDVVEIQNQTLVEAVRTTEALGKLKPKADIGIFVGYAPTKKAYGIYNNRTFPAFVAPEPFDSIGTPSLALIDQDAPSPNNNPFFGVAIQEPNSKESSSRNVILTNVHSVNQPPKHLSKWTKDHPLDNVIGNPSRHVSTRYQLQNKAMFCYFDAFISFVEPKNHKEALQESYHVMIITLKWIFKVKLDEVGGVLKNKARLVARVYRQEEGINFEESFAPAICQSSIEFEYNMKECFKALTDRLDWENPEGDRCPFYLSKPLPLKGCRGYLTVATKYFFNNDLEYLKSKDLDGKYTALITKTKAARYELVGIEDMILKQWSVTKVGYDKDAILSVRSMTVNKLHGYGYLEEIMKSHHQKRVKDVQLGLESYQKKLNITKPQKDFLGISTKELYTPSFEPPGVVYEDLSHHKRLVRADELYMFSVGMLKKVRDTLHHRLLNFRFGYNKNMPRLKWSDSDKRRSGIMVDLIDKQMLERRILINLERLVGAREPEMDYRGRSCGNNGGTMEQYMSKTRAGYGSGVARPKIEDKDNFELKGQFLKELHTNTFSGSDHEDANEHIEKVLEIVDLFHIPNITIDQVMLRAFPMSLTRVVSHWLKNKPSGLITTWEDLKTKFLSKYCLPACTAKKMEEINNFQQETDENLYQSWEGAIPSKTGAAAKVSIQEMAKYSQKWHNGTSRTRSTKTSDRLAAIQAQLDTIGREIKKVNEKVYAAQVGCKQCKGPTTPKIATQGRRKTPRRSLLHSIRCTFLGKGYRATALGFYQRNNTNPSNQGASIKTLEIQIEQISKVLQERGFGSLPRSTETNSRDHVKSISTIVKVVASSICCIGSHQYVVSTEHNSTLMYETKQMTIPFPSRLNDCYCENTKGSYGPQFLEAYSYGALHIDKSIPRKEKDPRSFTLPCYINNVCFNKALADLGASVSVMPLLTDLNLGLGELAHTKLTIELAYRTVKYPKGIAKSVLVGIGKFVFPVDFIILDMHEDFKVPLILGRPFLSTAHAKIDVFKRNITLRVGEEKIIFKSIKPVSSLIRRVYMLSLRERIELDLEARLMRDNLVLNRSLDPFFEDYIELNDLNVPLELRRDQVDDLMPTIKEGVVIEEFRDRNNARMVSKFFGYPGDYDHDKKIRIDCAHNLNLSYMISFEFLHANFFPILYVNVMSKKFYNSIRKDKLEYNGNNVVEALINIPIFVKTFSILTYFEVLEDMNAYHDEGMSDVIFGEKLGLMQYGLKK
nr:hypothetical protein [Tanacetum cinerariifolium]